MNIKTLYSMDSRRHEHEHAGANQNPRTAGVMLADPDELPPIDQDEAYQLMEYAGLTAETMDDVMRGAMATFEERRDLCWDRSDYHRKTIYEVCGITEHMYRRDDGLIRILMDSELLTIPAEDVREDHFEEEGKGRYRISTGRGLLTVFQPTVDAMSYILEDEWTDKQIPWDEIEQHLTDSTRAYERRLEQQPGQQGTAGR